MPLADTGVRWSPVSRPWLSGSRRAVNAPLRGCERPSRMLGVWAVLCPQLITRPLCLSRPVGESQLQQYQACWTGRTMACKRPGVQIPSAPLPRNAWSARVSSCSDPRSLSLPDSRLSAVCQQQPQSDALDPGSITCPPAGEVMGVRGRVVFRRACPAGVRPC
jgi:hypothetical protein